MAQKVEYYGTGRRKESVARVRLYPGDGKVVVNGKELSEYLGRATLVAITKQPLVLVEAVDKFDVKVNVRGGGTAGQAGAIRHGISRALLEYNNEFRPLLRQAGFLTRDPRMKERKKYGQKGARKRFQFSKR